MRVTLDDDAQFVFHTDGHGAVKQGTSTDMSQISFEKLQAYIAAANEAFDVIEEIVASPFAKNPYVLKKVFLRILQKVGD